MGRAKDLEKEMMSIKKAKIDVVVKQFEAQLVKEAQQEEKKLSSKLSEDFDKQIQLISAEKNSS